MGKVEEFIRAFFMGIGIIAFFWALTFIVMNEANAAECVKPVQVIQEGEAAPCKGFLFSNEAEKRAADARDDVAYYEKLVPSLEKKIDLESKRTQILEKRLDLYIDQSERLAKQNAKMEDRAFWKNLGMFFLGGLAMYGAYEVAN